ncbi:MAG: divergent polysaccharide deacetylase family protein [Alkalispirochaeta sp.]
MKRSLYIGVLALLLVASVSGIALLLETDGTVEASGEIGDSGDVEGGARYREGDGAGDRDDGGDAGDERGAPDADSGEVTGGDGPVRYDPSSITRDNPRIYLILDDGGHRVDDLRAFTPFPGVFTIAVLPYLEHSRDVARMTVALGHELILHQPMEALGGNDPGPGAIFTTYDNPRIRRVLRENLRQFPDAIGVNNHMGSKATGDERVMAEVASVLANRRLFFLDSRTIHTSVADTVAVAAGLPELRRDVFLDNVRTDEAISEQIDEGLAIAREKGYAVLIGHVTSPELARVLTDRYDEITAAGYIFAPLSELVATQTRRIAHENSGN